MIATANDHLADVYASLAAGVGIGLAFVGKAYDIQWLAYGDAAAGVIVSFLVLKLQCRDRRKNPLMYSWKKPSINTCFRNSLRLIEAVPGVKRIDRVRAEESTDTIF